MKLDEATKLEMELQFLKLKPSDRLRDVLTEKQYQESKKRLNKKGYE